MRWQGLVAFIFILASAINEGLARLPGYDGTVLRGADLPAAVFRSYRVGQVIQEAAFVSASQSRPFRGCHQMQIDSRGRGKLIADLAATSSEQEVLFPSGSRFEVIRLAPGATHPERCAGVITEIGLRAL